MFAMILYAMALVLCPVPSYSRDIIVEYNQKCDKYSYITCPCGSRGSVIQEVKMCIVRHLDIGRKRCQPCEGFSYTHQLCNMFRNCRTCASGIERCITCPRGTYGTFCTERPRQRQNWGEFSKIIDIPNKDEIDIKERNDGILNEIKISREGESHEEQDVDDYPIRIRIPRGGSPGLKRYVRDLSSTCKIPEFFNTADIDCTLWPVRKQCTVNCIYGYTHPEGISKIYECITKENKWKPQKFEECKQYVNCGVALIAGGDMNCTYGRTDEFAKCDITCTGDKSNEPSPKNTYICTTSNEWTPTLPYCATKTDQATVSAPAVIHKSTAKRSSNNE